MDLWPASDEVDDIRAEFALLLPDTAQVIRVIRASDSRGRGTLTESVAGTVAARVGTVRVMQIVEGQRMGIKAMTVVFCDTSVEVRSDDRILVTHTTPLPAWSRKFEVVEIMPRSLALQQVIRVQDIGAT